VYPAAKLPAFSSALHAASAPIAAPHALEDLVYPSLMTDPTFPY